MRADRVYRVLVGRTGRGPAMLAEADRMDHIEVVEIDDGEVVLFWDVRARDATRFARRLRADLQGLEDDEFLQRWSDVDATQLG